MSDVPQAPGLGNVAEYRPWFRRYVRPPGYSAALHIAAHGGAIVLGCAIAATQVSRPSALEVLVVPTWLLLGSAFVYWFHRYVLHRPRRFAYFAYKRHTLQHHRFYDYEHITRDERADLYVTIFPWWTGTLLLVTSYGIALGLTPLLGANVAYLTMFMMNAYMGLYELIHTVAHLPDDHLLSRMPVLGFLREHHRLHHDPALMGRYNFNIVIPLFDWFAGALVTERAKAKPATDTPA